MQPRPDRPFWGACPDPDDSTFWHFALWAPDHESLGLMLGAEAVAMVRDPSGTHRARVRAQAGDAYTYRLEGQSFPDPASRQQSGDVNRPSLLTLPRKARPFAAPDWPAAVLLEIHIGTFTDAGTFAAAAARMPEIAALGITMLEIMPIAQFGGARGWGYDTLLPYAPHPAYGTPDDFAGLVAAAHAAGIAVMLDVVYNHFGPGSHAIERLCPSFFDPNVHTPWGAAIDFSRRPVREFMIANAEMWVAEFGLDGLRLDAVHEMHDASSPDIVTELSARARAAAPGRAIALIAEDTRPDTRQRESGALEATWNDDYHNPAHILLTGETTGYYTFYATETLPKLMTALAEGHLDRRAEGGQSAAMLPPMAFVNYNQSHDHIGNRAAGERLTTLAPIEAARVAHALLLTSPAIPMLFMGEEEGSRRPFCWFADFDGVFAEALRRGRAASLKEWSGRELPFPDPLAPDTMAMSRPYADPAPDAQDWRALTARLTRWRAERVTPLLRSGRSRAADVRATGPASLHALWHFTDGTIETRLHLGTRPDPDHRWPDTGGALALGDDRAAFGFITRTLAP